MLRRVRQARPDVPWRQVPLALVLIAATAIAAVLVIVVATGTKTQVPPGATKTISDRTTGMVAELTPSVAYAHPGENFKLRISATGSRSISFGPAYRLQRRAGAGWVEVPVKGAFPMLAIAVRPGGSHSIGVRVPSGAPPGDYRVVMELCNHRCLDAHARFKVVS